MMFFAAYADLPTPPPPAPYIAPPAPTQTVPVDLIPPVRISAPVAPAACPLGEFRADGTPCPHPALWGLAQGSDVPGQTLGTKDPAYGAQLTSDLCEAKPTLCGAP